MRRAQTPRVELRRQFAHPVFVPHAFRRQAEIFTELRVQLGFWNVAPAAFESACLERKAAVWQDDAAIAEPLEEIEESQRGAQQRDGIAGAQRCKKKLLQCI